MYISYIGKHDNFSAEILFSLCVSLRFCQGLELLAEIILKIVCILAMFGLLLVFLLGKLKWKYKCKGLLEHGP